MPCQTGYGAVAIEEQNRRAAANQILAEWPGEFDDISDVATIDQLKAWEDLADQTPHKNEWNEIFRRLAPQTDAVVALMIGKNLLLGGFSCKPIRFNQVYR